MIFNRNFGMTTMKTALMVALSCLLGASSVSAQKKWHFGIGTGLARLNAQGDQGLNVGQFGPVVIDVDLDRGWAVLSG